MTKDKCQYIGGVDRTRPGLWVTVKHHKNWVRYSGGGKVGVHKFLTRRVGKGDKGVGS